MLILTPYNAIAAISADTLLFAGVNYAYMIKLFGIVDFMDHRLCFVHNCATLYRQNLY